MPELLVVVKLSLSISVLQFKIPSPASAVRHQPAVASAPSFAKEPSRTSGF